MMKEVSFRYPQGAFRFSCDAFSVSAGECVVINGANGSGKSTMLKLLVGILRPDKGCIYCDNDDTKEYQLFQFGQKIGYLFQEPDRQLFASTALEELTFLPLILGESERTHTERAEGLLATFALKRLEENSVLTLSRGEKQRLALCALLMQQPPYLLLDEPTTGLDEYARNQLGEYVRDLCSSGVGIVLVTHDHACASWADRIISLDAGVVAA